MALLWSDEVRLVDLSKNVVLTPSELAEKATLTAKRSLPKLETKEKKKEVHLREEEFN